MLLDNELFLESELLLEAVALINSKEDQIAQIESDTTCRDCWGCGAGYN